MNLNAKLNWVREDIAHISSGPRMSIDVFMILNRSLMPEAVKDWFYKYGSTATEIIPAASVKLEWLRNLFAEEARLQAEIDKPQSQKGLYKKYEVSRTDGRDQKGGDREDAQYFVLDLVHDKFAFWALLEYALKCKGEYEPLYRDLAKKLYEMCTNPEKAYGDFFEVHIPSGYRGYLFVKEEGGYYGISRLSPGTTVLSDTVTTYKFLVVV